MARRQNPMLMLEQYRLGNLAAQDERLQLQIESIEGPNELVESLGSLVTAATADAAAIEEAKRLEAEAVRVRTQGKTDLYETLKATGAELQELSRAGTTEPRTILESFVAVHNYSERFHPGWPDLRGGALRNRSHQPEYYDAEQLLAVFDAMKAGEPVVGLASKKPAGMLAKDAQIEVVSHGLDMQKNHLSIDAKVVLPIHGLTEKGLMDETTIERVRITSSKLPFVAGKAAVKAYFEQLTAREDYNDDRCGHGSTRTSNTTALVNALQQAEAFQGAGMDIDTKHLEAQIEKGRVADERHHQQKVLQAQRRRSRRRPYR